MNILEKEKINPSTLGLLMYLNLNKGSEFVQNIIREYLFEFETDSGRRPHEILEEAGYIKYIKKYPASKPWVGIRLSEKGEKILKEMNQKEQHHLAEFTLDYVTKEYNRIGADKTYMKGGGKLLHYISEFLYSRPSEYTERMIKAVISAYVSKFEYDKKYLNKMENLFFKPKNAFATKFSVEDSPICSFIDNQKDLIKYHYKIVE